MAIATDIEVNWYNTADVDNKIGLSDTLDQLSVNVFDDAEYLVGYTNKALKITKETNGAPHSNSPSNDAPWYLTAGTGYSLNSNNNPDGVYYRTILFAVPNNWSFGFTDSIRSNNSQLRIVTKLDLKKNKVYLTTTETVKSQLTVSPNIKVNESVENTTADGTFYIDGGLYYLTAADIYLTDNGYYVKFPWLIDHMYRNFDAAYGEGAYYCANYDIDSTYNYSVTCQWFANLDWIIAAGAGNYYNIETWNNTELDVVPDADNADVKFFAKFFSYAPYYWHCGINYSVEYAILMCACYGMYFEWNGTPLKPIIVNGEVTGYTDDMSVESDIDNWTDITGHNISPTPPVPPVPGDDEDNDDPVSTTGAPFGTGLAHYYVTTVDSAVLGQISEALGSWDIDSTKKDLYRNLISCKILKPPAGIPSTPSVFTIYGVKPQYNGADITIPAVNGNPDISFGPYTISKKFNDFRDYAPYTRAEIFLPYCGWCALPSHVVGRSVSVSYFTDVIAGTVKAVVFCEANPVAEAAGVMAYDIPFAAQNVGAKIQAANTGMLAYGKAALQLSAGIGQAVATKGKQGLSSIVNGAFGVAAGYNQLSMAANENYTEISGKAGDGCALAGIDTIIIKIVRPKYGAYTTPPYVPDGFAHTVGFLSMKEAKVSAASGLILCDNVDTSGIGKATDAERAEIKRVLETGLYVNNPPE